MITPLHRWPAGKPARVAELTAPGLLRRRLLDLGFVPGAIVTVVRRAPWGDPTAYLVRGAVVALRREEAGFILVGDLSP
ncbi:MAG TPA: ferrous iron transport protein A [Clostridia bacterium]|nr:ferrous iron transport protein A [Clostridia bacterium]